MGRETFLQKLGNIIDIRYLKKAAANPIPGSKLNLLLLSFHPYQGEKLRTFADGIIIHPQDPIIEFHLSNQRIVQIGNEPSERSMEWRLLEMLKLELCVLAKACSQGVISPKVKGFYGVNVLVAGAKRLGFTLIPIPKGWNKWWLGFWETLLRMIYYSFKTKKRASFQRTKEPYEVWITREELIKRYGKDR